MKANSIVIFMAALHGCATTPDDSIPNSIQILEQARVSGCVYQAINVESETTQNRDGESTKLSTNILCNGFNPTPSQRNMVTK